MPSVATPTIPWRPACTFSTTRTTRTCQSGSRSPARGRPIVLGDEEAIDTLWLNAEGDGKVTIVAESEYEHDSVQITQRTDDELLGLPHNP